jgi:sugar phosphate isomerase/epimerase
MAATSAFILSPDFPSLPEYSMLCGEYRESVRRARQLGYDGVEIIMGDPRRFDPVAFHEILEREGMALSAINCGGVEYMFQASLVNADPGKADLALEYLMASIRHCRDLGCIQQIGVARGHAVPGRPMRWFKDRLVEVLRTVAAYARVLGVGIVFEYTNRFEINTINTAVEALEIVERVASPNVGILIDTYHSYLEDPDVCQSIRLLRDHVRHFHLHDSNGGGALIGGGENRFDDILKSCAEIGYRGWFSDGLRTLQYTEEEVARSTHGLRDLYAECGLTYQARVAGVCPVAVR